MPVVAADGSARCLLAGFTHSAFAFGYESFVHKSKIDSNDVPPGALITFIQKGLQYLELEANLGVEVSSSCCVSFLRLIRSLTSGSAGYPNPGPKPHLP